MITARVSTITDYAWWKTSGLEWDWFLAKDRGANDRMRAGTALHEFLEKAGEGEIPEAKVQDIIFVFDCDFQLPIPQFREQRRFKDYGELRVTGKTDALTGKRMADYKLIIDHQVEGEQYMDSYQWRFYLDIFDADVFDYFIFQAEEVGANILHIKDVHKITMYRYPDLHQDCSDLAAEFYDAAQRSIELRQIAAAGLEDVRVENHQVESTHSR